MASNDARPTNRWLASVCTTRTACPALTASRTASRALYAAIPPLTPKSNRAISPTRLCPLPVVVLQLALSHFLEGDREVVLGPGVHHRRRELIERPLPEVVVVGVDLASALGRHDHAGVVRVHMLEQLVDAG